MTKKYSKDSGGPSYSIGGGKSKPVNPAPARPAPARPAPGKKKP